MKLFMNKKLTDRFFRRKDFPDLPADDRHRGADFRPHVGVGDVRKVVHVLDEHRVESQPRVDLGLGAARVDQLLDAVLAGSVKRCAFRIKQS